MTARTRMTASVAAVGAATLMGLAFAGPALADPTPYPPSSGTSSSAPATTPVTITLSCTFAPGVSCTLTVTGLIPGGTYTILLFSQTYNLGTFTANAQGVGTPTVTIPSSLAPGAHHIEIVNAAGQVVGDLAVNAAGSSSSSSSGLSSTGVAVAGLGAVGLALVGGGAALAMAGRRRRTHA